MTEHQRLKERAIGKLQVRLEEQLPMLCDIDPRLGEYYESLVTGSSAVEDDPCDVHNMHELLGAIQLLRKLRQYPVNRLRVRQVIQLYEGRWERENGIWHHIKDSGGFLFSGIFGRQHYRLTPIQVFMLTGVYGPHFWYDTGSAEGSRELLPTERVSEGRIQDYRRLCIEAFFFIARKFCKTTMGAFFQTENFFFGDYNSEGYCVANSQNQSKILFEMTYDLIHQLDPLERRIRFTATEINWRKGQPRQASIEALSAGGKTKDGLFAQICSADEFGAATYVNGKCDMAALVNVVEGSMGPRRERLTVHTTTAGLSVGGPCEERVRNIERLLERELADDFEPTLNDDRYFYLLMQPDPWEREREKVLTTPRIWHKVNPHIGITVQPDYYDTEIEKARRDGELKLKEVVTKLFNIFENGTVQEWIKAEDIRKIQTPRRIEDCRSEDGWVVLCGMDFSKGDDLHALTYLAVRPKEGGGTEFFADLDAWITEDALNKSSIRSVLESWINAGWLHVCPGAVLQPALPVDRIVSLIENESIAFIRWGYDSYQSREPINLLKAYLWDTKRVNPDLYVVPVSQTYASYNPAVLRIEGIIFKDPPALSLSESPLWPWEFGNCVIDEDIRMNNRKMIKRSQSDSCKVDNVQCLGSCFILLDQIEGSMQVVG